MCTLLPAYMQQNLNSYVKCQDVITQSYHLNYDVITHVIMQCRFDIIIASYWISLVRFTILQHITTVEDNSEESKRDSCTPNSPVQINSCIFLLVYSCYTQRPKTSSAYHANLSASLVHPVRYYTDKS